MFFMNPPTTVEEEHVTDSVACFASEAYTCDSFFAVSEVGVATADPHSGTPSQDYLSYSYVTMGDEPGRALVDSAAQHGLIGK